MISLFLIILLISIDITLHYIKVITTIINFILNSNSTQLIEPTHRATLSTTRFNGLSISVSVVDARNVAANNGEPTGRTLIWPASYAVRLDTFEMQRQQIIAETLKARIIMIECPGIGIANGAKMPLSQKLTVPTGDLARPARTMLGALFETIDLHDKEEIELILYSQGAALGVAMIAELGGASFGPQLKIPRVTIIEAVNDQPWYALPLLAAIKRENHYTSRYLNDNKAYPWLIQPKNLTASEKNRNRKQQINLLLIGASLRRPFMPILLEAIKKDSQQCTTDIYRSRIDIIKFSASNVSRLEKNILSVNQLTTAMPEGAVSLTVLSAPEGHIGYHHPAIHSIPIMATICRELLK